MCQVVFTNTHAHPHASHALETGTKPNSNYNAIISRSILWQTFKPGNVFMRLHDIDAT